MYNLTKHMYNFKYTRYCLLLQLTFVNFPYLFQALLSYLKNIPRVGHPKPSLRLNRYCAVSS